MTQELTRTNGTELVELSFYPTGEEAALIESVITFAKGAREIVVSGPESFDGANQALREVATLTKGVDARRKERTAPIDELKRQWMDFFRQGEDALKAARAALEQQTQAWVRKQRELAAEQQRRANEAAEKERRRLDALAAKNIEKGNIEKAVQQAERAAAVVAPIIAAAPTKAEGVSTRTYWRFKVVDQKELPHMYLEPRMDALQKLVDSAHEGAAGLVNGAIEVWSEERTVVRGR